MTHTITIQLNREDLIGEVKVWFDELFTMKYKFTIVVVNKAIQHLGIEGFTDTPLYNYLNSLHSIEYVKMKPETFAKAKEICYALIGEKQTSEEPVIEERYYSEDEFVPNPR